MIANRPDRVEDRDSVAGHPPARDTPSIADHYGDLLSYLDSRQRLGWIHRLVEGYYDGWRPSRQEVADLIAVDLNLLTIDEAALRREQRRTGHFVASIIPKLNRDNRGPSGRNS